MPLFSLYKITLIISVIFGSLAPSLGWGQTKDSELEKGYIAPACQVLSYMQNDRLAFYKQSQEKFRQLLEQISNHRELGEDLRDHLAKFKPRLERLLAMPSYSPQDLPALNDTLANFINPLVEISLSAPLDLLIKDLSHGLSKTNPLTKTERPLPTLSSHLSLPSPTSPESLSPRELKILMADDQVLNLRVLEKQVLKFLSENKITHFKIEKAQNGAEALDLAQKKNYDLIFMDIMMPEMNGDVATEKIRTFYESQGHSPLVVAVTGSVEEFKDNPEKRDLFTAIVDKPATSTKLEGVLKPFMAKLIFALSCPNQDTNSLGESMSQLLRIDNSQRQHPFMEIHQGNSSSGSSSSPSGKEI